MNETDRTPVYAKIQSPMIEHPTLAVFKLDEEGKHEMDCAGCGKHIRFSGDLLDRTLLGAACGIECSESLGVKAMIPVPVVIPTEMDEDGQVVPAPVKVVLAKVCPVCKGLRRGRGYAHATVDGKLCPESTEAKLAGKSNGIEKDEFCPRCQGPRRGRGYTHATVGGNPCPDSTEARLSAAKLVPKIPKPKVSKPNANANAGLEKCPVCGGIKKGRGFAHESVNGGFCPSSTAAKLLAAKKS